MIEILGLAMIYSWVHAIVIIFKKLHVTGYEKAICITAFTAWCLFIIGFLMGE